MALFPLVQYPLFENVFSPWLEDNCAVLTLDEIRVCHQMFQGELLPKHLVDLREDFALRQKAEAKHPWMTGVELQLAQKACQGICENAHLLLGYKLGSVGRVGAPWRGVVLGVCQHSME